MKISKILFLALSLIVLATSCKDGISLKEDALVNVPENTSSITAVNIQQLMDKADFKEVVKMPFYQHMLEDVSEQNPGAAAVLKDPYESGVDLAKNVYMTQDFDIANPENQFIAFIVTLDDPSKFKTLITSNGDEAKSADGFQFVNPGRNGIIAWNDNLAVLGGSGGRGMDYKAAVNKFFNTSKETSLANNKEVQKVFSEGADISQWFSSNHLAEQAKGSIGMQMAMAGFSAEMLKDNYASSYTNFNDGAIVSNSNYTINKELAEEFRHIFKDGVETDFSKNIPSENLAFAFSGALDIKGIKMILQKKGFSGFADGAMREYGLSVEDIAKALDGDFVVSAYSGATPMDMDFLVGTKINDKKTFQKFLDLAVEFEMLQKITDDTYAPTSMGMIDSSLDGAQLIIADGMLFFGKNANTLNQIKSGGFSKADRIDGKVSDILSQNIMGAFVDFAQIDKAINMDEVSFDELDDATMRFDRDDATFKLEMKDKDTNSLKTIFKWINKTYENQQNRKAM